MSVAAARPILQTNGLGSHYPIQPAYEIHETVDNLAEIETHHAPECVKRLQVAKHFTLPRDEVTKVIGIFGQRGSGKTYTAGVFQEEEYRACGRFLVFDPVRAHTGILTLKNVEGITNLDVGDSEYWANKVTEQGNNTSYVFDLSAMERGWDDAVIFVNEFCKHALLQNKKPIKVYIEEAHIFLPLVKSKATTSISRLGTVGRQYGWGVTLISQRPAQINKDILTQADAILAMRLMYPLDIQAMYEIWAQAMPPEQATELIRSLPKQRPGQGVLYSSEWLEPSKYEQMINHREIFLKQIQFRQKYTPHLAITPKFEPEKDIMTSVSPTEKDLEKVAAAGLPAKPDVEATDFKDASEVESRSNLIEFGKNLAFITGGYAWGQVADNVVQKNNNINYAKAMLGGLATYLGYEQGNEMVSSFGVGLLANGIINQLKKEGYIQTAI